MRERENRFRKDKNSSKLCPLACSPGLGRGLQKLWDRDTLTLGPFLAADYSSGHPVRDGMMIRAEAKWGWVWRIRDRCQPDEGC